MKKASLCALVAVVCLAANAAGNLLPASFVSDLCQKQGTGVTYLAADGDMPEGILVTTDKALDPVYSIETSAAVPGAVKNGDLIVLTVAIRGASPSGKVSVLAKFQDSTYTGALRGYLAGNSAEWTWCRVTGTASKDYEAGSMRLHIYPWTGAQQVEIRGWRLENLGQADASALPALPAAPEWPAGELHTPEEETEELPPLTPEQLAKKRYVMLKIDDVKNHNGIIHQRFARVAEYLSEKKLKSGFGVIVKSIEETPNERYIAWLKANAVENGGYIEFWDHGWDHAMSFTCTEDDACDRTATYGGEFGTSLQHQRAHLAKSIDVFREYTGLTMHTLGTAGNVGNADTLTALRERSEMKVWIFGSGTDEDITILGRWLNLEYEVGKVSYASFVQNYKKHRQTDYIVLQGHAAQWDDANYAEFQKVVELLESDGWTFVTPYEFHCLQKGTGESETANPEAQSPVYYVGYPGADPAAPYATPETAAAKLEDALDLAEDGATIRVAPGTYVQDGVILVSNAVTIAGDAADPSQVVFENTATRQWDKDKGNFIVRNADATLFNLTLRNGHASGTNYEGISKAGNLDLENGTVTNCVLAGGTCDNAGGEAGGARVRAGRLTHCVIEGSRAGNRAGALFVYQSGGIVDNCIMRHAQDSFPTTLNKCLAAVRVEGGRMIDCTVSDFRLVAADGKTTYTQLASDGVALAVASGAEVVGCSFSDYWFINSLARPDDVDGPSGCCTDCTFLPLLTPEIGGVENPFVVGSDKVSVTICNAMAGRRYGYRKSATLAGLAEAEVVWLGSEAEADGVLTFDIPREAGEESCFYRIVTE